MSHLDEGTLHALLDGELSNQEVREIQAHLGSCSACGARLQSVKEVMTESERLVGAIQFPGTPRRPAALDPDPKLEPSPGVLDHGSAEPEFAAATDEGAATEDESAPAASPGPRPPRPAERRPRLETEPVYDEPPPVLLVPDDSQWAERRRRVIGAMRWAALVCVAVGAGYIASEVRRTGAVPVPAPASRAEPSLDDSVGPVLSAEETARPDTGTPAWATSSDRLAESTANESTPVQQARRVAPTAPPPAREDSEARANTLRQASASPEPEAKAADETPSDRRDTPPRDEVEAVDEEEPAPGPDVRQEAAQALAELDRQRRLERAAAATAALDAAARRRQAAASESAAGGVAAAPPPAPAPAPRTLEQRSGIYLRIGLDEAARQLGRPVHVIEGMQQQFMGLVQGSASPGADGARPVVRVVYQDNQGRMILLDQQRIRPDQTWGTGETRWVTGEIGLALAGEPGPEILRNLRPRVR